LIRVNIGLLLVILLLFSIIPGGNFLRGEPGNQTSPSYSTSPPSTGPTLVSDKIAFVRSDFTYAAYQNNSFYNFYKKYTPSRIIGEKVTSDLDLLSNRPIPHTEFNLYDDKANTPKSFPQIQYFNRLQQHVRQFVPNSVITNLTDPDIDRGVLFTPDGKNAFDVVFLFHEEYVTQFMYDEYRKFVENGGTIVLADSNIFYAEVKYNRSTDSITLVKGHDWDYNGTVAIKSIPERWSNQTRDWVGSNFLNEFPTYDPLYFRFNPFGYEHKEEQHVTNKNVNILHDYGVYDPHDESFNSTVATYDMDYGKGRVIVFGIFAHNLLDDRQFLDFFDYIIIPRVFGKKLSLPSSLAKDNFYWMMKNGNVTSIGFDEKKKSISISLNEAHTPDWLMLTIPKSIFGVSQANSSALDFNLVGTNSSNLLIKDIIESEVGLFIPIDAKISVIKIEAMFKPVPFSIVAPPDITLVARQERTPVNLGQPTILGLKNSTIVSNDAHSDFLVGVTLVRWNVTGPTGLQTSDTQKITIIDATKPFLSIVSPRYHSVIKPGGDKKLMVEGIASDVESGIKKIDVSLVPYGEPHRQYYKAIPSFPGNWSNWNITLDDAGINGAAEIMARAFDGGNNIRYQKILIAINP
jgi:hypothetical protein